MALAIRFKGLIRRGQVRDYAHLSRLGNVTRARITRIMNLLYLAPDIQEALLFSSPPPGAAIRSVSRTSSSGMHEPCWYAVKGKVPNEPYPEVVELDPR